MASAPVDGTTLSYEVVGEGPTCLVMHGWPGTDHTYFRPALDRLARRLRLVYYDHRGNGRSGRPELETLTMEQLADDADALAAHLGAERALVLGHHHGGFVAQELALRHPERVAGLILVATTAGELGPGESLLDDLGPPPPPEVDVLQRVPPATDDELRATMQAMTPFFFHGMQAAGEQDGIFGRTIFNASAAGRSMQAMTWWSAFDRLDTVKVPALVLAGGHDPFCPPAQARRLARRMPAARAAVFEDSAHLPWIEEPDAFLTCVGEWLDDVQL